MLVSLFFLQVPPKIDLKGPPALVHEGNNITLICYVVEGSPKPEINWYKDNRPLEDKTKNITRTIITQEDHGTYTCEAKNEGGVTNATTRISVNGKTKAFHINPFPRITHFVLSFRWELPFNEL